MTELQPDIDTAPMPPTAPATPDESVSLWRSMIDNFNLAEMIDRLVCVIVDGRIAYINRAGAAFFGVLAPRNLTGRNFADFMPEEFRTLTENDYALLLAEKEPTSFKVNRAGDRPVYLSASFHPLRSDSAAGVLVLASDISSRRVFTAQLVRRERWSVSIMQNIADGVVAVDEQGRVLSVNHAIERIFGYTREELVGKNVFVLMGEPELSRHDGYIRRFIESGMSKLIGAPPRPVTGLHKNGSTLLLELSLSIFKSSGTTHVIGVLHDIRERQIAENALRESEHKLATLIGNLPGMVYRITNHVTTFEQYCSRGATELTGYASEEFQHNEIRLKALVHPADTKRVADEFQAAFSKRLPYKIRYRILTKDGVVKWVDDYGCEVSEPGSPSRIFEGFCVDITERVATMAQLREGDKLHALGQLAGGVAHDFNNILMVIHGYAKQVLQKDTLSENGEVALRTVLTAVDKAAGLTRQLLTFARRQPLETMPFRVSDVLEELKTLLRPLLGARFTCEIEYNDSTLCVETDKSLLSQALVNLGINARDAMPDGGQIKISMDEVAASTIATTAKMADLQGSLVRIRISDMGTGIDPDMLPRIFEPFFTTKEQGKGTGLGLAMVYGFVQQSQGHIDVKSSRGRGTTFSIYLPKTERPPNTLSEDDQNHLRAMGETILLAEDNSDVRSLVRMLLEDLGYTVLTAADGLEALEIEADHEGRIDLLLSDVIMPKLGGGELYTAMRESRPDITAAFMSGYIERSDIKRNRLPQDVELLQKPVDPKRLAQAIRAALDKRANSSREPPTQTTGASC